MSAQDQDVNMNFGFALRGDRQVERGLDSIVEKFARTGSFASAASVALEKFGRVFEVGLPIALGAMVLGRAVESIYQTGEEAIKTREKIDRMTSEPIGELDTSALESNLTEIGSTLQEIGTEHGKGYAEGLGEALLEGLKKVSYEAEAGFWNNAPQFIKDYSPAGMIMKSLGYTDDMKIPSYETAMGETGKLSDRARDELSDYEKRNEKQSQRLQRRVDVAQEEENLDTSTPKGKATELDLKESEASQNRGESQIEKNAAQSDLNSFKSSISDGHELTQQEIQKGVMLEKRLNEARTRLLNDELEQSAAQREINDFTREQAKFKRGDIIASHTRAIGGGGGYYSNHQGDNLANLSGIGTKNLSSGVHGTPGFNPRSMNSENPLKDFSDAIKIHTDAIVKATGGSLQTTSL